MKQTPESFKLYHFTYVTKINKNIIQNLLSQSKERCLTGDSELNGTNRVTAALK